MENLSEISFENAEEAVYYAVEVLEKTIEFSGNALSKKYIDDFELIIYLPFSFENTPTRNIYMLANKLYAPVGYHKTERFDYSKFPNLYVHLTKQELLSVIKEGRNNILWDYPYTPLNSVSEAYEYLTKLKRLLNILESKK